MSISEDGYFVCDICGDDTGRFDSETGNHRPCIELAALREEVERLRELEAIAEDVNEWLKRTDRGGTAHQRLLESALKG